MVVGLKVTLRGARMYDFVHKLINITLPRVRDFRGLSADLIDQQGNLSIGFKENIVFPEVKSDELDKIHGLEVSIETTAKNKAEGLALLKYLGFPFKSAV
jgi:large subunit ribosomal protein L5